ncbi:NUDIX domain-containing protein [Streptacidiphilus albus]|uniref:NUDIX domain-containing protein n=1 Tax=Streptacidiphilus albus TaxID=105425 RepID=UPI00054B83D8|nr:NUDIX domain-containing protein [Streptacidiphilus albus]
MPLPEISVSVKAAVLHEDQVLLLSYEDHSGFHYNLPGGKAQEGEGLRDAVHRKVLQETGLEVTLDRLLLVTEYVPAAWNDEFGTVQKTQYTFLARPLGDTTPRFPEPPDPDQVGFEWTSLVKLGQVFLLPRINAPLLAALDGTLRNPFIDKW